MGRMDLLRLAVFDENDLEVVSAHLQDAILSLGDMKFSPSRRSFVALLGRFDWQRANAARRGGRKRRRKRKLVRHACLLRVGQVEAVSFRNLEALAGSGGVGRAGKFAELLAIRCKAEDAPSGHVELILAGDGCIRLKVECLEMALNDLGVKWKARSMPCHEDAGEDDGGSRKE